MVFASLSLCIMSFGDIIVFNKSYKSYKSSNNQDFIIINDNNYQIFSFFMIFVSKMINFLKFFAFLNTVIFISHL